MANEEQVKLLRQDVEGWNKRRNENPVIAIDLRRANLRGANLKRADLGVGQAWGVNHIEVHLTNGADLRGAHFNGADLRGSHFYGADLRGGYFNGTDLKGADLRGTDLKSANLKEAWFSGTVLGDIDLSETKGLDEVRHLGPSLVSTSTLERSKGKIPEKFLRGCGLSDWEIESAKLYQPGLSAQEVDTILYRMHDLRVGQALQINPLFISYSHKDGAFLDKMEMHLNEKGIRFWRDIHDATVGRLEKVVDRAIRQNPIELLILSENSVKSDWVEHEARVARELEKELGRDVLCPVALDEAWKDCKWPARLREQILEYHILDFSNWEDDAEFGRMFRKLVDGLDLFYKEG